MAGECSSLARMPHCTHAHYTQAHWALVRGTDPVMSFVINCVLPTTIKFTLSVQMSLPYLLPPDIANL